MPTPLATFRAQISRVVQALRPMAPAVLPLPARVRPMVGVQERGRFSDLKKSCQLLSNGFAELDGLMAAYLKEVRRGADSSTADAERFLDWLATRVDLTEEQLDLLVCVQSRYTVEFVAVKQRLAHARFQELRSNNTRLLKELSRSSRITVELNPVHVWATLETHVFLDDEATIPATVLFYGVEESVEGAVIEVDLIPLIQQLQRRSGNISSLQKALPQYTRQEVLDIVGELARLGIVALS
jgi:hypothetical protein